MKSLTIKDVYKISYYFVKSIVLSPLVLLLLLVITFTCNPRDTYLESHFKWLLKACFLNLPAILIILFWDVIITIVVDGFWLDFFGNNFIFAFFGIGFTGMVELIIIVSTFFALSDGISKGMSLLEQEKPYI